MNSDYTHISEQLRDGQLVAFLGAGASATYTDTHNNRTWTGLPTAASLVQQLAARRSYIDASLTLPQAAFMFRVREGRNALEQFLLQQTDKPTVKPLPAHVVLANLPFASFITTNYDTLLEQALKEAKRKYHPVIDDDDVTRLRPTHAAVVKVHGCVSRPSSMIAADDEYEPWTKRTPIVEALLRAQLAQKTVLFLGFGLADADFRDVFNQVKASLGDRAPRSYAVVRHATDFTRAFWQTKGVTIVEDDLTEFLRGLLRASAHMEQPAVYQPAEDWINNAFFDSLHKIRSLPSETQVIDAFLDHFMQELSSATLALDDIVDRAARAVALVLTNRPNFEGLRKVGSEIEQLRTGCSNKDEAELVLRDIVLKRQTFGRGIAKQSSRFIQRGDSILVYSQSMRVLELLKGAPKGVQDSCALYLAECRPKSPMDFQDAISIAENMRGSGYDMIMVPDAVIGNLLDRRQVTKVLMGAHAVYLRNAAPLSFVNTCGSQLIIDAAAKANIPVLVVAEMDKTRTLAADEEEPPTSYQEEEDLFRSVLPVVSDLKAQGQRVSCLNIGYDLCKFAPHVTLVTDIP